MHVVVLAPGSETRVPVLSCADALRAGADVEVLGADSDVDVDTALATALELNARLVIAGGDGQLRAVLRRAARMVTASPKQRPPDLSPDRTMGDLPAVGLLPLPVSGQTPSLVAELGLPNQPTQVAEAVLAGQVRRLDLFRNDAGSLTLHGVMVGSVNDAGQPVAWRARIDVDDRVLATGDEALLACAVANAGGYSQVAGLPLIMESDPTNGTISVSVATPLLGETDRIEVRRAAGRAVSISPRAPVAFTDDGVDGELARKRTWWVERGAWGVYMR